ncbi:hypothetical protein NLX85_15110 [Micromonospora sp. A3M-1-15]|uniref:hypothetical protein n=1 Tax=Micromonospora sp. A3M-1-15 TaxID=2962035 RepID=UPI0020B7EBC2|nr:hypothetical protein [Micromonospora sp. A3M-1-15]MCP3784699.1 hypothetical protein [Micromonospora sp. A3M-1-15]
MAGMTGLLSTALVSILVLLVALGTDVWVYTDARDRQRSGNPVSVSLGSIRVGSPEAWFLGCLILWVVFVPLYLTATGRNPFARSGG